jgi:ATP-dependent DNA helicase RecG
METQVKDYKSVQIVTGGKIKDLAVTCVCFANAQGGVVVVGFEDKTQMPPVGQRIEQKLINDTLERLRGLTFSVALSASSVLTHENGGEYFEITIHPSNKIIATTSDGKIFMRITDKCHAVRGEDLQRVAAEKDAFQWELCTKSISIQDIPLSNISRFAERIKQSDRVKDIVKEKSDIEILEHYNFVENNRLTNLGVLWLGTAQQRSRLSYPIIVQYIVYDAAEQKTRKIVWDDHALNPEELIYAVEKDAVELNYSYEMPDGLFRKQIRHYPKEVIRELLINAFAHKSYLISADITIEVYPDRMSITSPGGLPLGITGDNILHEKHRRNPHLIKVLHDLKLMEAEGSGYDLIYEKLSSDAKAFPIIESNFNKLVVTLGSNVLDLEALRLLDYISQHYLLTQREKIAVGIVARHQKILSTELTKILQLPEEERLRTWTAGLVSHGILKAQGNKKGTSFIINPLLLSQSTLNLKPSLKTIEPYVLEELIKTDLRNYPDSTIGDIKTRIKDVDKEEIQRILYKLTKQNSVLASGSRIYRKYKLPQTVENYS